MNRNLDDIAYVEIFIEIVTCYIYTVHTPLLLQKERDQRRHA